MQLPGPASDVKDFEARTFILRTDSAKRLKNPINDLCVGKEVLVPTKTANIQNVHTANAAI